MFPFADEGEMQTTINDRSIPRLVPNCRYLATKVVDILDVHVNAGWTTVENTEAHWLQVPIPIIVLVG